MYQSISKRHIKEKYTNLFHDVVTKTLSHNIVDDDRVKLGKLMEKLCGVVMCDTRCSCQTRDNFHLAEGKLEMVYTSSHLLKCICGLPSSFHQFRLLVALTSA